MDSGMGKCEECFRGQVDPLPPAVDPAPIVMRAPDRFRKPPDRKTEEVMPKQRTDVDWLAVQNDRSDGMSVADICKKYRVANSQVYTKTKGAVGGGRKVARPFKARAAAASRNGGGQDFDVEAAIASLKAKREKIDRSIAALEELL
jgi:hypothetical protein